MFLPINELTDVSVLIRVLQIAHPISKILLELSNIHTSISINNLPVAFLCPMLKLSLVYVSEDIYEHSFTVPPSFIPLSLIFFLFLWNFICPITMLQIVEPSS